MVWKHIYILAEKFVIATSADAEFLFKFYPVNKVEVKFTF